MMLIGEKDNNCDNFEFWNDEEFNNFVVIGLGWLGDTLLADGVCKNIKYYNPKAHITFVVLKAFADIPKLIPEVDDIVIFDKNVDHKGLLGYLKFARLFHCKKNDLAIIIHPHERSLLCAKATGAKKILSLPLKGAFNPLNLMINEKREYIEEEIRNEYKNDYNADYLNIVGISTKKYTPAFFVPDYVSIDKFNLPEKYIVLVPEGKDELKHWDYKNLSLFVKNSNIPVVLTGTAKTQELAEKLINDGINFINLCGQTSILELALLLKKSYATVSVDTGSMHLAYGLGVQTICLFFVEEMVNEWLAKDLSNVHLLLGKKFRSNGKVITQRTIDYRDVLKVVESVGVEYAQV